jgi:outer membrane lipoprotein-sorting protein
MKRTWFNKMGVHGFGLGGALIAVLAISGSAQALDPNTKDPAKIFQASEDADQGDKQTSKMTMTLIDSSGRKRERVLQGQRLKFKGGTKSLMFFESPADMRNTGFLSIDYDDPAKDDDQWLYMPALHKSTRIASQDKAGSFLGSDISYSDMNKKDVKAYDVKLIAPSEKVDGEDCWVIEAQPKTAKEKAETGYLKAQSWISKKSLLRLQVKVWLAKGNRVKYIKFTDIKKIEGVWIPGKWTVRTMKDEKNVESTTIWQFSSVKLNQPEVKDVDFTQSRLEKGL